MVSAWLEPITEREPQILRGICKEKHYKGYTQERGQMLSIMLSWLHKSASTTLTTTTLQGNM